MSTTVAENAVTAPPAKTSAQKLAALREAFVEEPEATGQPVVDERTRSNMEVFFLGGLFVLALLAALDAASAVVLPTVLAFMLKLLLQPMVRVLERVRIPRRIGAIFVMFAVAGVLGGLVTALSVPAAAWTARLPQVVPRVEAQMVALTRPIGALQKFIQRAEQAGGAAPKAQPVAVVNDSSLGSTLFEGTRVVLDGVVTTIVVLYFLLVAGDTFLRRLVELLPKFSDKKHAVEISQQIEADISAYLVTITIMNAAVGIATAVTMWACGLGDPVLWGAVAFLLNYIPIVGPLVATVIFFVAGLVIFDDAYSAFLPPAVYFVIHLIEGETLTPMLVARRFTLNPVLVILSIVFWFWMWGVPGVVLAVPMLAITKIICDGVRPLMPLGHFLGG